MPLRAALFRDPRKGFIDIDIITADEIHAQFEYLPDTDMVVVSMEGADPVALSPTAARELARVLVEHAARAERAAS